MDKLKLFIKKSLKEFKIAMKPIGSALFGYCFIEFCELIVSLF